MNSAGAANLALVVFFDDYESVWEKPAAGERRTKSGLRQSQAVRRIEEGERKRFQRMRGPKLGGVAPENTRGAAEAKRGDVLAQQRACLRALIDKQGERGAVRQCLDSERAGAGKKVEHPRAGDQVAVCVQQNIKQRLPETIGGGADRRRFRAGERAAAQVAGDHTHQRRRGF